MSDLMLLAAIEQVSRLSRTINECVASGSDSDMLRFVSARRQVPDALRLLAQKCDRVLESLPRDRRATITNSLNAKRATFQKALAEIQAKWPVSGAKSDLPSYRIDKNRFNTVLEDYLQFLRTLP
jgi:uncharacterized protein YlxP (DUF503 family)